MSVKLAGGSELNSSAPEVLFQTVDVDAAGGCEGFEPLPIGGVVGSGHRRRDARDQQAGRIPTGVVGCLPGTVRVTLDPPDVIGPRAAREILEGLACVALLRTETQGVVGMIGLDSRFCFNAVESLFGAPVANDDAAYLPERQALTAVELVRSPGHSGMPE